MARKTYFLNHRAGWAKHKRNFENPKINKSERKASKLDIKKQIDNLNLKRETYYYPAIFSKEEKYYNVKFIDFEDIFTFGDSFEDAYSMAQDALYNMLPEYKNKLPRPTVDYINIGINKNEFIVIIELNIAEYEGKIL